MAITGFGVTELNLIGSSGTPNIESPNNLNLNAVTVAISTNATVGGTATFGGDVDIADTIYHTGDSNTKIRFPANDTITFHTGGNEQFRIDSSGNIGVGTIAPTAKLDVRGDVNVTGVCTATSFVGPLTGNASSASALQTGREIGGVIFDGTGDITPIGNDIVTSRWTLGASGSSHYTFTGPGGLSAATDPTIYLARGQTYEFVNSSGGSHPFQIRVSDGGSAYNTGVTNNGASSGTIKFEVPFAAPNTLVYQCTAHSGMLGNIVVYPSV